jgi:hypothetical protein
MPNNSSAYIVNNISGSGSATIGYVLCARNSNDCREQIDYAKVTENAVTKIEFELPYDFFFIRSVSFNESGRTKLINYDRFYCSGFDDKPVSFSRLISAGVYRDLIVCGNPGFIGETVTK